MVPSVFDHCDNREERFFAVTELKWLEIQPSRKRD